MKNNILVVDDTPENLELLYNLLTRNGYKTRTSPNGVLAIKAAKLVPPDLILLDIKMPKMNGFELCKLLKQDDKLKDVPVLFISALNDTSDKIKAFEVGGLDYISKPFQSEEILARIKTHLSIRKYQTKIESTLSDLNTKTKQLEETQKRLIQSEKMAGIGQLAAGVAHEINNPTGFIMSNFEVLQKSVTKLFSIIVQFENFIQNYLAQNLEDSKLLQDKVNKIKKTNSFDYLKEDLPSLINECSEGTHRIKNIVSNLKDFAHPGTGKYTSININKEIEKAINLVFNELKYKCDIIKEYGELPNIEGNSQKIEQAFMNIFINASQAIEKKGVLNIKTEFHKGYIYVKISDNGAGIPQEIVNKIFDPFYTTKDVGEGTGLGLYIVYGIIEEHKGEIDVESKVNKGTKFIIKFPVN